jgi:tetratricopeptide (TPR) repeat protein
LGERDGTVKGLGRGIIAGGALAAALLAGHPGAALAQRPAQAAPVEPVAVSPQNSGRWLRAESDHVIVYSDEDAEVARRVASDLEALDQTLRSIYGKADAPSARKFPIYLVRPVRRGADVNETYQRFLPGATTSSLSMDVATTDDIFAVVVRDNFHFFGVTDATAGDDSVLCAYAYHFFSENFAFRQPRWLTKGAAIYYSAIDIRPDSVVLGATPALFDDARIARNLGDMPGLIAEAGDDRTNPSRYDARSALLVRYLWADPDRKARLATYLDRLEAGDRDPKATWAEVFGQPVETLEPALRVFLDQPRVPAMLPRPAGSPPRVTIRRMPAGADDLILELQRLKAHPYVDRASLLRRFRKAATRRPDERYSRQALARAEITIGDRDKGERLLETLLREDGGNLEALRLMGTSKLYRAAADGPRAAALLAEARAYLARADAVEPNDYQTLFLLAQTTVTEGAPSPERLALLRRAVTLAPDVAKIRIVAAVAFLQADDAQTAFSLLKPMSADPNGGLAAAQARRVLDLMAMTDTPVNEPRR